MKKAILLLAICSVLFVATSFGQENGDVYTIRFRANKTKLTNEAKATLDSLADRLRQDTILKSRIFHCSSSKRKFQRIAWKRIKRSCDYLSKEKNISGDRLAFAYDSDPKDCNVVEMEVFALSSDSVPVPLPKL